MIKKRFILIGLGAFLLQHPAVFGQRKSGKADTVLKSSTIEVIQSYKPRVKQSVKPDWKPQLPPVDTTLPRFNPDVPQQTLYYSYNSQPLRPLALGKRTVELPYANYVMLGGGNLSTFYGDIGIGSICGENYETAIHLHHLSQKGIIANQQSSQTGLEADGYLHNETSDWHFTLGGLMNTVYNYGYDHVLYNYDKDAVRQNYTGVKLAADMSNKFDSSNILDYHPSVFVSYYGALHNTAELTAGLNAPVTYWLSDQLGLHINVEGVVTSYTPDTVTIANNYIAAAPGVRLQMNDFYGHALAGFAAGKGGNTYFLPDVLASFSFPLIEAHMDAGWKASLRQNTYSQMTTENPFMLNTYSVNQTRSEEVFLQFRGGGGNHLSYSVRGSWWNYQGLPTFMNDTGDQKNMYVIYQNAKAVSGQVSARYIMPGKWAAGLSGTVFNFYETSDAYAWHIPSTRIKGDVSFRPVPKLEVTGYVSILGGIHARDTSYTNVKLKTIADIGIGGEYLIVPRLSVFMQANNLLNNKYQRWQGFQAYGFNIYGGLRLKF